MQRFVPLMFVVFMGCGPSPLDRHVRAANDFRLANDQAVPAFRAVCGAAAQQDLCRRLTAAQHEFVDAHIGWVRALVREANAGHWRFPGDTAELRTFCRAHHELLSVAAEARVPAPPVAASSLHVCEDAQ